MNQSLLPRHNLFDVLVHLQLLLFDVLHLLLQSPCFHLVLHLPGVLASHRGLFLELLDLIHQLVVVVSQTVHFVLVDLEFLRKELLLFESG